MKSRQDFATEQEWLEYYRHYAAAMALQGLLSVPTKATDAHTYLGAGAELAVIAAEQLITQLNKPTTNA